MTDQPINLAMIGTWELLLILGILAFFALVTVGVIVLAVVLSKNKKPLATVAPTTHPANQPPILRS